VEQASSSDRAATPPAPISIESGRTPDRPEPKPEPAQTRATSVLGGFQAFFGGSDAPLLRNSAEGRARSMAGTNAYATLGEQGIRRARVLDLGFGGVAIELETQEDLPENLMAVLHVPILPPVRVSLKPVWSQRTTQGNFRVGCAFVS